MSANIIAKDLRSHSNDVEQVFIPDLGIPTRLNRSETVLIPGVNLDDNRLHPRNGQGMVTIKRS